MGVSEFFFVEDMQLVGECLVVQAARACSPPLDFCLYFEVVQCGGVSPWGMGVEYIFFMIKLGDAVHSIHVLHFLEIFLKCTQFV